MLTFNMFVGTDGMIYAYQQLLVVVKLWLMFYQSCTLYPPMMLFLRLELLWYFPPSNWQNRWVFYTLLVF